jgi:hypothetical protein
MDIRSYFNVRYLDVIQHLNGSFFWRLARSASEAVTGTPPLYKQDGCTETARDKPRALPLAKHG